jgi:transcriptional regulator with XRE-family HTH domain
VRESRIVRAGLNQAMTFPDKLRSERARLGLTQAQTEKALGLTKKQIATWEQGRNTPRLIVQESIIDKLKKIKRSPKI